MKWNGKGTRNAAIFSMSLLTSLFAIESAGHCQFAKPEDSRIATDAGRATRKLVAIEDDSTMASTMAIRRASAQEPTDAGAFLGPNPNAQSSDLNGRMADTRAGMGSGQASGGGNDQDLATKLVDPTASVTTLNFQNRFVSSFYGRDDQQNTFVFQPVIPFRGFGMNHIFRATMPYRFDGPLEDGLDPVTLFDLIVIPASWGRWGVGPVVSFLPNSPSGRDTIQAGPAIGFVTQKGKWTLGAFNQNLISEDTNVSFLQPVIAYTIDTKWTLSAGDLQEGYDWKSDQWFNLPIGFQVARLVQVGDTTLRVGYNPQYNFRDLANSPEWTHLFAVSLIVK